MPGIPRGIVGPRQLVNRYHFNDVLKERAAPFVSALRYSLNNAGPKHPAFESFPYLKNAGDLSDNFNYPESFSGVARAVYFTKLHLQQLAEEGEADSDLVDAHLRTAVAAEKLAYSVKLEKCFEDLKKSLDKSRQEYTPNQRGRIEYSLKLAFEKHWGQFRLNGELHVDHLVRVARKLAENHASAHAVIVGLLHDIVEDQNFRLDDIASDTNLGSNVARDVAVATKARLIERAGGKIWVRTDGSVLRTRNGSEEWVAGTSERQKEMKELFYEGKQVRGKDMTDSERRKREQLRLDLLVSSGSYDVHLVEQADLLDNLRDRYYLPGRSARGLEHRTMAFWFQRGLLLSPPLTQEMMQYLSLKARAVAKARRLRREWRNIVLPRKVKILPTRQQARGKYALLITAAPKSIRFHATERAFLESITAPVTPPEETRRRGRRGWRTLSAAVGARPKRMTETLEERSFNDCYIEFPEKIADAAAYNWLKSLPKWTVAPSERPLAQTLGRREFKVSFTKPKGITLSNYLKKHLGPLWDHYYSPIKRALGRTKRVKTIGAGLDY